MFHILGDGVAIHKDTSEQPFAPVLQISADMFNIFFIKEYIVKACKSVASML